MKVIIAGSRSFSNFALLCERASFFIGSHTDVTIVSGTARGADQLGEAFAAKFGHAVERFPADWDRFGKRAGYIRNKEMAKAADCLIAFWDGKSRGTSHMIDLAREYGLRVRVVRI